MSSTRHAKPGTPPRQERFASSYQTGLLANLVAKRCAQFEDADECAPIWFLQWLSWQRGGLAAHVTEMFPARYFESNPAEDAEKELFETCLHPDGDCPLRYDFAWEGAAAYRARWIKNHSCGVETTVGRRVTEAFDYARETRSMVLVDGVARIGKTFSARAYCERSAGLARYVQVPFSNDDTTFFRAIARALGVSSSLQLKALELRARVEEVLQSGDLLLVLDESAWLWPQTGRQYSLPSRVNWLLTALVNFGCPVALITTPQFHASQKRVETQTGWTSEQFMGRIGHIERLPQVLPIRDLLAVASAIFPEGDEKTWQAMAGYADMNPQTKLAGMDALAKRARWLASQDRRAVATPDDLRRAMRESCVPVAIRESRTVRRSRAAMSPTRRDTGAVVSQIGDRRIFTEQDEPLNLVRR
jgi:hypothetical protein